MKRQLFKRLRKFRDCEDGSDEFYCTNEREYLTNDQSEGEKVICFAQKGTFLGDELGKIGDENSKKGDFSKPQNSSQRQFYQ